MHSEQCIVYISNHLTLQYIHMGYIMEDGLCLITALCLRFQAVFPCFIRAGIYEVLLDKLGVV